MIIFASGRTPGAWAADVTPQMSSSVSSRHDDVAGREAAIDWQHDAGDRRRGIRGEKGDRANDLDWLGGYRER